MDPRIGRQFLHAGLGFGGFCLPKDIQAFIRLAERVGISHGMMKETERVNRQRIGRLIEKSRKALWVLKGKKIAFLGLAFKPNTDDIRFSPALDAARRFLSEGAQLRAYDPEAMDKVRASFPEISSPKIRTTPCRERTRVILATEWDQFRNLDWERIHKEMARPLLIDARNFFDPATMRSLGFEYHCFGRPE